MLMHLYLPFIKTLDGIHLRSSTPIIAKFILHHRETLKVFQILDTARDHFFVRMFCRKLEDSFSLQELRMDLQHTRGTPLYESWKRAADFLTMTGKKDWYQDVRSHQT